MFTSLSTSNLISKVRLLADIRGSNFVNDAEILTILTDTFQSLYNQILMANQGYFLKETESMSPVNSNLIMFPTDFYKLRMVERTDCEYPVYEKTLYEVSGLDDPYYYTKEGFVAYVLFPDHIKLYPKDTVSNMTFKLYYARDPLSVTDDKMQVSWEKYMEYKTAYIITVMQDNPRTALLNEALGLITHIKMLASERQTGPKTITDLDGRYPGDLI